MAADVRSMWITPLFSYILYCLIVLAGHGHEGGLASLLHAPRVESAEPRSGAGTIVTCSWYGAAHQGRLMADGTPFDMRAFTCAHRTLPLGQLVRISTVDGRTAVVLKVTDRGPFIEGRDLDVSYAAAQVLRLVRPGVSRMKMEIIARATKRGVAPWAMSRWASSRQRLCEVNAVRAGRVFSR